MVKPPAYSLVSEAPGVRVTAEAMRMVATRYAVAADRSRGRDVLEVACGAGMGLGALAATARSVVGGDYDEELLRTARRHYGPRVPLVRFDAQQLPFRSAAFDVVVLYEALYYLPLPAVFLAEARRLLRPDGILLICSANPERATFNPSPFSTAYWPAGELAAQLKRLGFTVELAGAFRDQPAGTLARLRGLLRHLAVKYSLIPQTMKGKELLKRVFVGSLTSLPPELQVSTEDAARLEPLPTAARHEYKVIYVTGHLPAAIAPINP